MDLIFPSFMTSVRLGLCFLVALAPVLGLPPSAQALGEPLTPLTLDASFGSGGVVRPFPDGSATAVAVQEDDFIVAAGAAGDDFALVRLTPDGLPDPGFGVTGVVTTDLGGVDHIRAMALQPDHKVVVVGDSGNALAVARYTITGTLDAGFGNGGYFTTTLPSRPQPGSYRVEGMAVDVLDSGQLLVGGRAGPIGGGSAVLICVQSQGALDPGCGPDGVLTDTTYSSSNWVRTVLKQTNGQILVLTNWYSSGTAKTGGFRVTRWNADLSPDLAYGTGGSFESGPSAEGADLVPVAARGAWVTNGRYLWRLTENGSTEGGAPNRWPAMMDIPPIALALRPSGELVSVGSTMAYTTADAFVRAFDPTGHLTSTLTLDLGDGNDYAQAVGTQSDGAIIVAGQSDGGFFVARVTGEPFAYLTLPIILNGAPPPVAPARVSLSQSRSRRRPRRCR